MAVTSKVESGMSCSASVDKMTAHLHIREDARSLGPVWSVPPKGGEPGVDVFGQPVPAAKGQVLPVPSIRHTAASANDPNTFVPQINEEAQQRMYCLEKGNIKDASINSK